jgi:hypothetical protein
LAPRLDARALFVKLLGQALDCQLAPGTLRFFEHKLAHAMAAMAQSGFAESLVYVIDNAGGVFAGSRGHDGAVTLAPVMASAPTRPLFHQCFTALHQLGGVSPATALAIENHFYVSATIATLPTDHDPVLDNRRHALLPAISNGHWLVANTNSKVRGHALGTIGTVARREGDGFRITGQAAYTSLATQGDLLVFITEIEGEGPAVFAIASQNDFVIGKSRSLGSPQRHRFPCQYRRN